MLSSGMRCAAIAASSLASTGGFVQSRRVCLNVRFSRTSVQVRPARSSALGAYNRRECKGVLVHYASCVCKFAQLLCHRQALLYVRCPLIPVAILSRPALCSKFLSSVKSVRYFTLTYALASMLNIGCPTLVVVEFCHQVFNASGISLRVSFG